MQVQSEIRCFRNQFTGVEFRFPILQTPKGLVWIGLRALRKPQAGRIPLESILIMISSDLVPVSNRIKPPSAAAYTDLPEGPSRRVSVVAFLKNATFRVDSIFAINP